MIRRIINDKRRCKIGQKFKHKCGDIVEVIELDGEIVFEIESIGIFDYIDDDYVLYEI